MFFLPRIEKWIGSCAKFDDRKKVCIVVSYHIHVVCWDARSKADLGPIWTYWSVFWLVVSCWLLFQATYRHKFCCCQQVHFKLLLMLLPLFSWNFFIVLRVRSFCNDLFLVAQRYCPNARQAGYSSSRDSLIQQWAIMFLATVADAIAIGITSVMITKCILPVVPINTA